MGVVTCKKKSRGYQIPPPGGVTAKMDDATCNMATNLVSSTQKTSKNMYNTMVKSCSLWFSIWPLGSEMALTSISKLCRCRFFFLAHWVMRVTEVLRYVPSIRPEVPTCESQNHGVKLPPYQYLERPCEAAILRFTQRDTDLLFYWPGVHECWLPTSGFIITSAMKIVVTISTRLREVW